MGNTITLIVSKWEYVYFCVMSYAVKVIIYEYSV